MVAVLGLLPMLLGAPVSDPPVPPSPNCSAVGMKAKCDTKRDGGSVTLWAEEAAGTPEAPPASSKLPPPIAPGSYYLYWQAPACGMNSPFNGSQVDCTPARVMCRKIPHATGPGTVVWAAYIAPGQVVENARSLNWKPLGVTCWSELIPDRTGLKAPSLRSLIKKEFRKIPFTAPTINVQPSDHKALVTKPEYVHITFDGAGNGPGEVYTATLLGHTVTITPQLLDVTYDWGDGSTTGPTTDRGGRYPDGKITHAYDKHGTYTITTTATYTASFSIDGATYEPTNQTATRTSSTTVTVVESYNDLVKD